MTTVDAYNDRRQVPFTPDPDLFPFESRWFESSVGTVHYIDEGQGRPILLMHGNPDWSFLYREMIPHLADRFRLIAIDYPGFGLSSHPVGYSYLPRDHAQIVSEVVEHLDLQDTILMGQDWGGPIGMDVASRNPERFSGLILGNTFFFPAEFRMMRMFSSLMKTRFMQRQVIKNNFFVKRIMRTSLQKTIDERAFRHYIDVAPTPESRAGHAVFPAAITNEEPWLAELEQRVDATLLDRPTLLVFGMKDRPMTSKKMLARFRAKFPSAPLIQLKDAGHFFQEDEPEAVSRAIVEFFGDERSAG